MHVDTEGGDFVAGGNGTYINNLLKCQGDELSIKGDCDKVALVTPAYTPDGGNFCNNRGYHPFNFLTQIYNLDGKLESVDVRYWKKELSDKIDLYAIGPDLNHNCFFITKADPSGNIEQIRSIPERFMKEQSRLNARLIELSDILYAYEKNLSEHPKCITKDEVSHYQLLKQEQATKKQRLLGIFQAESTTEISLYSRNAHFHELAGKFIEYIVTSDKATIEVIHSHDYGNVMQHIRTLNIPSVNTFHSEPGKGLVPYYIRDQLGADATQRGNGLVLHHMVYTVSVEYQGWLSNPRNPNSHYTIPMDARGRITHVPSIPNKALHNFDSIIPYLGETCSAEKFKQLSVPEKKKLAKFLLSKKIKTINPEYYFDPEKTTILFLSRISRAKGSEFIEDVIKSAKELNANILICGYLEQHDPKFSHDLVKDLKIKYPKVPFFIGKEQQAKIGNLHRAASDIGVGMSFEESFGLSYSECLCYGCHCVVTDVGGTRSAILNDPTCATVMPLYRGADVDLLNLQSNKFTLANLRDDENLRAAGNPSKYQEELECVDRQYNDQLLQRTQELRTQSEQLNERIITASPSKDSVELRELACKQYLANYKLDCLLGVNYVKTREIFRTSMRKACYRVECSSPSISSEIHQKAQEKFSESTWVERINLVYRDAREMCSAKQRLTNAFFQSVSNSNPVEKHTHKEGYVTDDSEAQNMSTALRYTC